jgi:hypothetical protein
MATDYSNIVDLGGNTLIVNDIKTASTVGQSGTATTAITSSAQTITGVKTFSDSIKVKQAVTAVHDTAPTIAELTTAFGDPATLGRGFVGTVDDADGDTNFYWVCVSDASFFFIKLTKAAA